MKGTDFAVFPKDRWRNIAIAFTADFSSNPLPPSRCIARDLWYMDLDAVELAPAFKHNQNLTFER
jgi:hypothetical protein